MKSLHLQLNVKFFKSALHEHITLLISTVSGLHWPFAKRSSIYPHFSQTYDEWDTFGRCFQIAMLLMYKTTNALNKSLLRGCVTWLALFPSNLSQLLASYSKAGNKQLIASDWICSLNAKTNCYTFICKMHGISKSHNTYGAICDATLQLLINCKVNKYLFIRGQDSFEKIQILIGNQHPTPGISTPRCGLQYSLDVYLQDINKTRAENWIKGVLDHTKGWYQL